MPLSVRRSISQGVLTGLEKIGASIPGVTELINKHAEAVAKTFTPEQSAELTRRLEASGGKD